MPIFLGSEMTKETTELIFRPLQSVLCLSDIRRDIDFNVRLLHFLLIFFSNWLQFVYLLWKRGFFLKIMSIIY